MNPERLRAFYLETQVNNSSPGQRLVMLYDGLLEFAESAETHIAAPADPGSTAQASRYICRCIDILTELSTSLRHEFDPVLCGTLHDLYVFFSREFSAAFEKREVKKIRAIVPLIRQLREAWATAERRRPAEIAVATA